ncbi:MAG: hypothetical protein B7Z14_17030, partial [Bosea sp. 32-68-6]
RSVDGLIQAKQCRGLALLSPDPEERQRRVSKNAPEGAVPTHGTILRDADPRLLRMWAEGNMARIKIAVG